MLLGAARMYKKASKELKEQLEALGENKDEKIKMLHSKLLEKIHECNKLDRNIASQQVAAESFARLCFPSARAHAKAEMEGVRGREGVGKRDGGRRRDGEEGEKEQRGRRRRGCLTASLPTTARHRKRAV